LLDVVVTEVARALLELVVAVLEAVVELSQPVVLRTVTPTGVQMPWANWMVAVE
jgi:hypothetical protein